MAVGNKTIAEKLFYDFYMANNGPPTPGEWYKIAQANFDPSLSLAKEAADLRNKLVQKLVSNNKTRNQVQTSFLGYPGPKIGLQSHYNTIGTGETKELKDLSRSECLNIRDHDDRNESMVRRKKEAMDLWIKWRDAQGNW